MRNFDPISPLIGPVQRVDAGDFFGLRKEYRRCALRTLRQREGYRAPVFVNGRWMFLGDDRKYHCQAVGHRKQPSVELVDDFWGGRNAPFETLNYVGGVPLDQEVKDLERDAKNFQRSENVSFGGKEVPCPDLKIENPGDDSEVDTAIQEYIKRHAK